MSRYEHLNIYKETYNLSKILFWIVSKFPKDYRITLWNKILNTCVDILELVLIINSTNINERNALFSKLLTKLNLLSVYIKLAQDLSFFVKESIYISLIGNIWKLQKMSKNWEGAY